MPSSLRFSWGRTRLRGPVTLSTPYHRLPLRCSRGLRFGKPTCKRSRTSWASCMSLPLLQSDRKCENVRRSDVDDAILPILPHLTYQTPYTPLLLTTSIVTLLFSIPLVYLIPFRLAALALGLLPFFFTHPFTQSTLLPTVNAIVIPSIWKPAFSWLYRILDDDKLEDKHWRAELRQVEVFENERWSPHSREPSGSSASAIGGLSGSGLIGPPALGAYDTTSAGGGKYGRSGWGKSNLKGGERKAWTRGRDGWSGVAEGGDIRSVLFLSSLLCTTGNSHRLTTPQQLFDFCFG